MVSASSPANRHEINRIRGSDAAARERKRKRHNANSLSDNARITSPKAQSPSSMTGDNGVVRIILVHGVTAMKTIVSALIALSVLAGVAAPANALDTKTFWEQQDRQSY